MTDANVLNAAAAHAVRYLETLDSRPIALVHEYPDTDRLPVDEWHMEEANAGLVILMLER
jgi:hypothetical protein